MTLRLRLEAGGLRTLSLVSVSAMNLEGVVEESVLEEPVTGDGLYQTLAGQTELASRLREFVDPVALRPLVAVDIDREIRDLRAGWLRRAVHRVRFDRIVAHTSGATRSLQEVVVTELAPGVPGLETVAERLRVQHGVGTDGLDTLERASRILAGPTASLRPDAPHEVRGAFVVLRGGSVALTEGSSGLTLPTARGSGEELARAFLSELFDGGHAVQDLELIGFAQTPEGSARPGAVAARVPPLRDPSGGVPVGPAPRAPGAGGRAAAARPRPHRRASSPRPLRGRTQAPARDAARGRRADGDPGGHADAPRPRQARAWRTSWTRS